MNIVDIKNYIKKNKITYAELSRKSGVPLNTLKNIFSGRSPTPRIDTVNAIISALEISQEQLMFEKATKVGFPEYISKDKTEELAVYSVSAKKEKLSQGDYCFTVTDDSMINSNISQGDIIFFKAQSNVSNGEIAVVLINNSITVKKVYFYKEKFSVALISDNVSYPPLLLSGKEINNIKILGKVICVNKMINFKN